MVVGCRHGVFLLFTSLWPCSASFVGQYSRPNNCVSATKLHGWFDSLFPQLNDQDAEQDRIKRFPEQYPATYEFSDVQVDSDGVEAALVRPLLKQTMLEGRALQLVYDAKKHGWNPKSFHQRVDGKGAAIVLAKVGNAVVGGYNPKGWASLGGARPSVAAFLFGDMNGELCKLPKVGGGGLACAKDDPDYGISFGPDGLVIALQPGRQRSASSKLGPYFERGTNGESSLFPNGAATLDSLQVLVGVYGKDEEIPYSGGVLDMTSG